MDTRKIFLRDTVIEHNNQKINVREFYNNDGIFINEEGKEEIFISKEVILALKMQNYLEYFYETDYKTRERV